MSTLWRHVRACLTAMLVAGLLVVGSAAGNAVVAAQIEGTLHGTAGPLAEVVRAGPQDSFAVNAHERADCCSTAMANCCTAAAILVGDSDEPGRPRVRSVWPQAAPVTLRGLGSKVNRHPPRPV